MCERVQVGSTIAIICGGRRGQPHRPACKCCPRESTKLCDFPVVRNGRRATCDVPICDDHATSIGPDRDLCPWHAKQWKGLP